MPSLREAQLRHARHYEARLRSADNLYRQDAAAMQRGLALFDLERPNIQTGQAWAAAHGEIDPLAAELCSAYALDGSQCLSLRLHPSELFEWYTAALASARRTADRRAEAMHLGSLGAACAALGESRQANELYHKALTLARSPDIRDRRAEGGALCYLGGACMNAGQPQQAIKYFEQWLAIAQVDDRRDEGTALMNLGVAYLHLHDNFRAIEYFEQALAIARETGNRKRESDIFLNLGVALWSLENNPRVALQCFDQAATIAREIGDRAGEGGILCNVGSVHAELGDYPRAIETYNQALAAAQECDDRGRAAVILFHTSLLLDKQGDRAQAIGNAKSALAIMEEIEHPIVARVRQQLSAWGAHVCKRGAAPGAEAGQL